MDMDLKPPDAPPDALTVAEALFRACQDLKLAEQRVRLARVQYSAAMLAYREQFDRELEAA
jgi:hypothetical protein